MGLLTGVMPLRETPSGHRGLCPVFSPSPTPRLGRMTTLPGPQFSVCEMGLLSSCVWGGRTGTQAPQEWGVRPSSAALSGPVCHRIARGAPRREESRLGGFGVLTTDPKQGPQIRNVAALGASVSIGEEAPRIPGTSLIPAAGRLPETCVRGWDVGECLEASEGSRGAFPERGRPTWRQLGAQCEPRFPWVPPIRPQDLLGKPWG